MPFICIGKSQATMGKPVFKFSVVLIFMEKETPEIAIVIIKNKTHFFIPLAHTLRVLGINQINYN